jgi:hypothetical protein
MKSSGVGICTTRLLKVIGAKKERLASLCLRNTGNAILSARIVASKTSKENIMNYEHIEKRINDLREWQYKASDFIKHNEYIQGYNEAVKYELEFLYSLLDQTKKT